MVVTSGNAMVKTKEGSNRQHLLVVISLLMIIVISAIMLPQLVSIILRLVGVDISVLPVISFTLLFQFTMLGLFIVLSSKFPAELDKEGRDGVGLSWSLKHWIVVYGIVVLLGLAIQFVVSQFGGSSSQSVYDGLATSPLEVILLLCAAVLVAPIAEELVFRKFLIDRLEPVLSGSLALMLSSLLFSMIHWLDDILSSSVDFTLSHMVSTFILGLVLGYIYQQTRSIVYPIIVHAINNLVGFSLLLVIVLFPITDQQLSSFLRGETTGLSNEALRNLQIYLLTYAIIAILALAGILLGLIRLLRYRDRIWSWVREGLDEFLKLFKPHAIYATLFGLAAFVLIPLIFVTTAELVFIGPMVQIFSLLGYVVVLILSARYIKSVRQL